MWNDLWYSLGAASGTVATVVVGARAHLGDVVQLLSGREMAPPIEAVEKQAESIARILREEGVVPNRLGIDGVPGSGKSTLARALAAKLELRWSSLDYKDLSLPQDFRPERTIFEHHRLFRTQDVDVFDALVYIGEPPRRSRAKTVRRGRGRDVLLATVLDYGKLKRVGEIAFEVCEGKPVPIPDGNLILKIKPPKGFRAIENITRRLRDTRRYAAGMSKEEMLFLLAHGSPQDGLMAYCQPFACFAGLGGLARWLFGPN